MDLGLQAYASSQESVYELRTTVEKMLLGGNERLGNRQEAPAYPSIRIRIMRRRGSAAPHNS